MCRQVAGFDKTHAWRSFLSPGYTSLSQPLSPPHPHAAEACWEIPSWRPDKRCLCGRSWDGWMGVGWRPVEWPKSHLMSFHPRSLFCFFDPAEFLVWASKIMNISSPCPGAQTCHSAEPQARALSLLFYPAIKRTEETQGLLFWILSWSQGTPSATSFP